ncbi:MAG: LptA/OstA family protein [Verrucomicrobiota bacterium]
MKMHLRNVLLQKTTGWLPVLAATLGMMLTMIPAKVHAQDSEGIQADAGTVVTSNRFRLDLSKKEGVFAGGVRVVDPDFELTAEELIAYFDDKNQVERLVARGKVEIQQGTERSATCREAEYSVTEKSLKLNGDPVVTQDGNEITGTIIKIFPEGDRMEVDGRSKVEFFLD